MIYPIAHATLVPPARRADPWTWVVAHCPLCAGRHIHGAGDGSDPRALLGHRVAHCVERVTLGCYVLVEVVPAEHAAAGARGGA